MGLTDGEFSIMHSVLYDELFYPDIGKFDQEETALLSSAYDKVMDEAKRRGFWWAK